LTPLRPQRGRLQFVIADEADYFCPNTFALMGMRLWILTTHEFDAQSFNRETGPGELPHLRKIVQDA
jgi:hypothetical protein